MSKEIHYKEDARDLLKRGVDQLANAVKVTLGPKGQNVIIESWMGLPQITKDGVTVAKSIDLPNKIENMGSQLIKDVAAKTATDAGDGTTTATVLAQAIFTAGLKNIAAGANSMDLKRGIDKAVLAIVADLKKQSRVIGMDPKKIEQVGTISANNDSEIGKLIATAMVKVKRDGVITVEDAKGIDTTMEVVKGLQFDRGYISPYFVTDPGKMECVFENPLILIHDRKISNMKSLITILEKMASTGKPILIIAEDVDAEALSTLVINKLKAALKVCAVRAPAFGDRRTEVLEDIAILTNGILISEISGHRLETVDINCCGRAERVIIGKNATTIVGGAGKKTQIEARAKIIRNQIKLAIQKHEKEAHKTRLARLTAGVAILRVGASSEVEMKEKKDRIDDALSATKAAVEEGIVPGGGVAYIHAIKALKNVRPRNMDENTGIQIIRQAIEQPLRTICENAGAPVDVVINSINTFKGAYGYGYNARDDRYENMFSAGIIDPTKVTRIALENAASVASLLLTTACTVSKIEVKEE